MDTLSYKTVSANKATVDKNWIIVDASQKSLGRLSSEVAKMIRGRQLKAKSSRLLVERAVRGMLPKTRLGRALFNNLYVYEGAEHLHEAQKPQEVKLSIS